MKIKFNIIFAFIIFAVLFFGCADNISISDNHFTMQEKTENKEKYQGKLPENIPEDVIDIKFKEEKTGVLRNENGGISVLIIKKTMQIKTIYGPLYSELRFEKPVLSGETEVIAKINALFDEEEQEFYYGCENSLHFKEGYFDQVMYEGYNKTCTVWTDITYIGENILSVHERLYFAHVERNDYGITIDMTTGNILPADYFINETIEEFNEKVISMILEEISPNSKEVRDDYGDEKIKNLIKNYSFADYKYYYDGKNLNLIFPEFGLWSGSKERAPYIMRID